MILSRKSLCGSTFPLSVNNNLMPTTTAQPQRVNPRPNLPVESPYPVSLTYQNKQLALYRRLKSRLSALKYHYDRIKLDDDTLYSKHVFVLSRCIYLLDNTNFICNKAYKTAHLCFSFFPTSNDDHVIKLFGRTLRRVSQLEYRLTDACRELKYAKKYNKNVEKYQKKLESAESAFKLYQSFKAKIREENLSQRRSILKKRLRYAIAESANSGWFMVFASLTADDFNLPLVFKYDSTSWTDYVRSVDRAVGIRCHGSWDNAVSARSRGDDFHKYFAVVELGSKRGRPHIHVIHMMKQLPAGCTDPNLTLSGIPYRLNIDGMRHFWPHGQNSTWIPMRYSNSDAFSKLNWRWPSPKNKKTGKYVPVPVGSAMRVANYVCKYINKSYSEDTQRKAVIWRTKMSRNLGLNPILKILPLIPEHKTLQLVINPPKLKLLNQVIPSSLLRRLLFKKWLLKYSTKSIILSGLARLERRESILKSFNALINETQESSPVNSGDTMINIMPKMDVFNLNLQLQVDNISHELFGADPFNSQTNQNVGGYTGERYHG